MAIVLDDAEVTRMAEALAARLGVTPEEAVRRALGEALAAPGGLAEPERPYEAPEPPAATEAELSEAVRPIRDLQAGVESRAARTFDPDVLPGRKIWSEMDEAEQAEALGRLRAIQQRFAEFPPTGLKADRAFFDWLNDE